ncbi:MAG: glycosyltransferase family 4 protein [Candidatus Nanopelagicales bacterium]|nr:glycosyltransferase family 4 protein [Candidatus Nanopelagicales bacterium]
MSPDQRYDLVVALSYYTPYVSGLTNVARDVAEFAARSGLSVAVVTSQHVTTAPRRQILNGVFVYREPVIAHLDRAVLSPRFLATTVRLGRRSRMLNLHMPLPEAGAIALLCPSTPLVLTYQCDPPEGMGGRNEMIRRMLDTSSRVAINRASIVVPSTLDYARHSRILKSVETDRLVPIPPPTKSRAGGCASYRETAGTHVGFMGRITSEKGLDVLINAFLTQADSTDRLLIAGEGEVLAGGPAKESAMRAADGDERVRFLGHIPEHKVADFYASLDIFALPSTNSFEAFGIVQVEALLSGVPVIASDLPGVRVPVETTGGGRVVSPGDVAGLTRALRELRDQPPERAAVMVNANKAFSANRSLDPYLDLHRRFARELAPQ